ncbi:hypothetical protein GGS23DRAFT_594292 [Durotheca rogersii]|uniref:uncharacterized protein n=1 Tax=Durotheca rogersii TaxID=419775 RepID=UPI00221F9AD3|nr:uncharacterized protein GGS23DRAFT_594292 [Durotheca rogersii]KAI5866150.1 hypothetical protein GGS23DRAFT_594292 [Durotheca rogersii]
MEAVFGKSDMFQTNLLALWRSKEPAEYSKALLEEDDETNGLSLMRRHGSSRRWQVLTLLHLLFFSGGAILYAAAWAKYSERNACLKVTSTYSPILDEVDMPLTDVTLNGSLWQGKNTPIWRGYPDSNETMSAWARNDHMHHIVVTREQVIKLGKDPGTAVKLNDEYWGLGDDAYAATLDFPHQVHCLNRLRKEAFRYWRRAGATAPEWTDLHWLHLLHCTEMLMEHILCNADAGFITFNWMEHESTPSPDMSVRRKCRDWRQLVDYEKAYRLKDDVEKWLRWRKPEEATALRQPQDWWDHREQYDTCRYLDDDDRECN